MEINLIDAGKKELNFGLIHHVTRWYVKFALPFSIDYFWDTDSLGNRHKQLTIGFLCFSIYLEYWNWANGKKTN
jgi:hypothetical protein